MTEFNLAIDNQHSAQTNPNNMGSEDEDNKWPPWLKPLLREDFFGTCKLHAASHHKSECNMYCLDCVNGALCPICLSHHKDHRAIQIRRSSYHDVIRVSEIQKYLDISSVQTYVINGAKVVFLNERPQPRQGKGVTNTCHVCERSLPDSFQFCSLGCKIVGTSKNSENKMKKCSEKKRLSTMIGASEPDDSYDARSKKVRSFTPPTPTPDSHRAANRRKGIPHRAPMGTLILQY